MDEINGPESNRRWIEENDETEKIRIKENYERERKRLEIDESDRKRLEINKREVKR